MRGMGKRPPMKWSISPYNVPQGKWKKRLKAELRDVTVREGEDSTGRKIPLLRKLRLAEAIETAGFERIDVGFPGSDLQAFKFSKELGRKSELLKSGLVVGWQGQASQRAVVRSLDAGCDQIDILLLCSEIQLAAHDETLASSIAKAIPLARLCAARGVTCFAGLVDVTRTSKESLMTILSSEMFDYFDGAVLYDTVGVATPDGMRSLVELVSRRLKK